MTTNQAAFALWVTETDKVLDENKTVMERIVVGTPIASERDRAAGISFTGR